MLWQSCCLSHTLNWVHLRSKPKPKYTSLSRLDRVPLHMQHQRADPNPISRNKTENRPRFPPIGRVNSLDDSSGGRFGGHSWLGAKNIYEKNRPAQDLSSMTRTNFRPGNTNLFSVHPRTQLDFRATGSFMRDQM